MRIPVQPETRETHSTIPPVAPLPARLPICRVCRGRGATLRGSCRECRRTGIQLTEVRWQA